MENIYSLEKLPPSTEYLNRLSPNSTKILKKTNINLKDLLPVKLQDMKNKCDDSVQQQILQQRWKQDEQRRIKKLNILLNLRQKLKNNEYDINRHQKKSLKNKQNNTKDINNKKSNKKFHTLSKGKKSQKQKRSKNNEQYYCNYFVPKTKDKKIQQKQNSFSLSQKQFIDNEKKKQRKNQQMIRKNIFDNQILCQQNIKSKNSPKYEKKEKVLHSRKKFDSQMEKKYRQLKIQQNKQIKKMLEIQMNEQAKRDQQIKKVSGKQAIRLSKIHFIERMQIKNKINNLKKIQQQILEDFKNQFLL